MGCFFVTGVGKSVREYYNNVPWITEKKYVYIYRKLDPTTLSTDFTKLGIHSNNHLLYTKQWTSSKWRVYVGQKYCTQKKYLYIGNAHTVCKLQCYYNKDDIVTILYNALKVRNNNYRLFQKTIVHGCV